MLLRNNWFSQFRKSSDYAQFEKEPVAYFCAEFALENDLPTYAGGLGILTGDFIKEAARQKFPLVGVGLLYQKTQAENIFLPPKERIIPQNLGLSLVVDEKNQPILVSVPIQDRNVFARAWKWKENGISVYLLDTNIPQNTHSDRLITNELYVPDKETRIKQEMILGIGGFRLLQKLGIQPKIYHLNEEHSIFLALELIRNEMIHHQVDFQTAVQLARQKINFTTHTLISSGMEIFSNDLVSAMFSGYAEELQVPVNEIISLGLIQESTLFSLTMLALRLSSKINGVSKVHVQKASQIWTDHPIEKITNGIFIPRWDKMGTNQKSLLWSKHQKNKERLLSLIKKETGQSWEKETLLAGWARRVVPYKRPLTILENPEKLQQLPIKIVLAGAVDEDDPDSFRLFEKLKQVIQGPLKKVAVFLPNYNLEIAQILVAGCDIWLNTPVVGTEACGTSGMKAALNCVLPVSTPDGWVAEAELFKVGWIIEDYLPTTKLLQTLENEILPMYYIHLQNPTNSDWLEHMKNARQMVLNQFSMERVLQEYIQTLYLPTAKQKH